MRCTGQNNQLTAINAHVGYALFTVVMTTFTVAPSSGVPYADALLSVHSQLYVLSAAASHCQYRSVTAFEVENVTKMTASH